MVQDYIRKFFNWNHLSQQQLSIFKQTKRKTDGPGIELDNLETGTTVATVAFYLQTNQTTDRRRRNRVS